MKPRDRVGVLLKIAEECAETIQICSKCIFYGVDNTSPKNGNTRTNREKLIEEIGDVMANIKVLVEDTDIGISWKEINNRAEEKYIKLEGYLPEA